MLKTEGNTSIKEKLAWGLWIQGHHFCATPGSIILITYSGEQVSNSKKLASVFKRLKMKGGLLSSPRDVYCQTCSGGRC